MEETNLVSSQGASVTALPGNGRRIRARTILLYGLQLQLLQSPLSASEDGWRRRRPENDGAAGWAHVLRRRRRRGRGRRRGGGRRRRGRRRRAQAVEVHSLNSSARLRQTSPPPGWRKGWRRRFVEQLASGRAGEGRRRRRRRRRRSYIIASYWASICIYIARREQEQGPTISPCLLACAVRRPRMLHR